MIETAWHRAIVQFNNAKVLVLRRKIKGVFLSPVSIDDKTIDEYYNGIQFDENYVHKDLVKTDKKFALWYYLGSHQHIRRRIIE